MKNKGRSSPFLSLTGVKWRDMTFMKTNVYLLSVGNEATLKQLETPIETTCPVSNITRYDCLSIEVWYNVTVKDFSHQTPLTVRGLMYSTLAKACESANMVRSRPYTRNAVSKGEETLAEVKDLWSMTTAWPSWGRVRFALDMDTQYSQKGDSNPLWSEVMKYPFISWACAGPLLRTCASLLVPLMSLSLSKDCSHVVARSPFVPLPWLWHAHSLSFSHYIVQ